LRPRRAIQHPPSPTLADAIRLGTQPWRRPLDPRKQGKSLFFDKGKGGELANLTYPNLAGVIAQAHRGIERVRQTPHLAYSFLRHAGLSVA